jgi:AraC-like DNA-binding protein
MCDLKINVDDFNPKMLYTFIEKFDTNSTVSYHCHDFLSLIYILAGTCTYNISGVPHKVKKGDLLVLNPHVYHGKVLSHDSEIREFQVGFENFHIKGLPPNHFLENHVSPIVNVVNYENELLKCCSDTVLEQGKNQPALELALKSIGMRLLSILFNATFESSTLKEKGILNLENYDKTTIVNTVLEFINDNYMYNLTLDIISQNMYLSPAYISKIFKESTGDSPINYLIKLRLSKAKKLLENGDQSIRKVSLDVGYPDVYHFSKLFKKYYGCPPSKLKHKFVSTELIKLNS